MMQPKKTLTFTVNGNDVTVTVPPGKPLLWVLRDDLNLTGPKPGCETGECGACTVLVDGEPVNSCLMFAAQADGRKVTTIEGLIAAGGLDPVVEAFVETGASQCGYCIPGFVMSAKGLLSKDPYPSLDQIKAALAGNICRCGHYPRILEAIQRAAEKTRGKLGQVSH